MNNSQLKEAEGIMDKLSKEYITFVLNPEQNKFVKPEILSLNQLRNFGWAFLRELKNKGLIKSNEESE